MIDRLEVLVPENVPKRHDEWRKYAVKPAKIGLPYVFTLDADFHLSLRVHQDFRVPTARDKRHFKVDFTDTRLLSAADLLWRLASLFETEPERTLTFQIARIDFAADVHGIPVDWFKRHCRVKGKRNSQAYEVSDIKTLKGAVTSVVFGKRPDLYRIYDRVAEKRNRGADVLHQGLYLGSPTPILTRIERQCSGRSLPNELRTLGGLFEHGAGIDPFPRLECSSTDDRIMSTEDWSPQKWLMSEGLAAVVRELGEATVRARLNRAGNASRYFSKYSDLLRAETPGVTADHLREIYRIGTLKQLNLPTIGTDGKPHYPQGGLSLTL